MNRTLVTVVIAVGTLVLGVGATTGIYEATVVSRLQSDLSQLQTELSNAEDAAIFLQDSLDDAETAIESCQETVNVVSDAMTNYWDAYRTNRAVVDNFFDRYNFAAGDAVYLYAKLFQQDDTVSSAASTLASVTDGDLNECLGYSG